MSFSFFLGQYLCVADNIITKVALYFNLVSYIEGCYFIITIMTANVDSAQGPCLLHLIILHVGIVIHQEIKTAGCENVI